ncbi:hypothetical protein TSAR_007525 [Trichomalopsis sarcophagae]|uniref:Uncharacterized protein n=1 Tax=Trichomalopsis sarcophagae TaxID=543379 RepID=A0A232ELV5_9HYME|nr:hypothetical protein TSAR_007525 [Trichomalopsis sarcophagae]
MRMLNPTPTEFMSMILRILRYVLECVPDMTQSEKKQMIRITKKLLTIKRAILKRNKRKHTRRQSRYMKVVTSYHTHKCFESYRDVYCTYRELGRKLNDLCDEKRSCETHSTAGREDKRTCLPFPETTNQQYGWLSRRPDFQLENYGSYIVKYPNPMDEIVLLEGDVPTLAAGKGFLL